MTILAWIPNRRILRNTCTRVYGFESEDVTEFARDLCEYAADVVASAKYTELGLTGAQHLLVLACLHQFQENPESLR